MTILKHQTSLKKAISILLTQYIWGKAEANIPECLPHFTRDNLVCNTNEIPDDEGPAIRLSFRTNIEPQDYEDARTFLKPNQLIDMYHANRLYWQTVITVGDMNLEFFKFQMIDRYRMSSMELGFFHRMLRQKRKIRAAIWNDQIVPMAKRDLFEKTKDGVFGVVIRARYPDRFDRPDIT